MKNPKPPILLNIPKLSREEIEQVDPSQKWNGIGRPPKWKTNLDKKNKG